MTSDQTRLALQPGPTATVARFLATTRLEDMTERTRTRGAQHLTDSLGVILAGTVSDLAAPLRRYLAASGDTGTAPIAGMASTASPTMAALCNGTLGHALDYDDANSAMRGHPSVPVLAALMAWPTERPVAGRDLLEAFIVGIEAATRVSQLLAITPDMPNGWHFTGTMGTFAAIAAVARLARLSEPQICTALGLAASLASGLHANFGTMTKPLHSGLAARNGLTAVQLTQAGTSACTLVLDGPNGLVATHGGPRGDLSGIASVLGAPFVFDEAPFGTHLKLYPCCYAMHRALSAALQLTDGRAVRPEDVAVVQCRVLPHSMRPLKFSRPKTGLEGKFSMQYGLAAALLDGRIELSSFTDEAVMRPEIARLIGRIRVIEDEACQVSADGTLLPDSYSFTSRGFVEVTVILTDGSTRARRVYDAEGSAARPLDWPRVGQKFLDCAAFADVDPILAERTLDRLRQIEGQTDLGPLFHDMLTGCR
jgi:2-methylcitrate dehydratase PrpD